jgi:hypothetical protein
MAKFKMGVTVSENAAHTARLGAATGEGWDGKEVGKAVKMVGDSRYDHCVAGDPIEGFMFAVEDATLDGYSIGSVQTRGRKAVIADGLEATPGTGAIAVGDYVVTGTAVAQGTALTDYKPKVTKATLQPGVTEAGAVTDVNNMLKLAMFAWRVVSFSGAGTGAVGDTIVIERV